MKHRLLFCFLLAATVFPISAQNNIPKPTHEVNQLTTDPLSPLKVIGEIYHYYNANGELFEQKVNHWDGVNWKIGSRIYYNLNASGQPTLILYSIWDENTLMLVENNRITFGYQTNGLQNYRKQERWDMAEGIWKTESIDLITYNSMDKVEENIYQFFYNGGQTGSKRDAFLYDAMGRQTQQLSQNLGSGIWKNNSILEYSYPGTDDINYTSILRLWDDTLSNWGPMNSRFIQTGTALQTISVAEYTDGAGNWLPANRITKTYDNDGKILDDASDVWDFNASTWKISSKNEYSYNPDQSPNEENSYSRDFATDLFYHRYKVNYDYGNYPVSEHSPTIQSIPSISPNPTADLITIEIEGDEISNITLLDLRGNVIFRTTTASKIAQISLTNQPAGHYLLHVEQGGAINVLPVVKQ